MKTTHTQTTASSHKEKIPHKTIIFDLDHSSVPDYGRGVITDVYPSGYFFAKYDCKELKVMHSPHGMRWDKEGKSKARAVSFHKLS